MDFLIAKLSFLDLNLKREQEQAVKELYSGRDVLQFCQRDSARAEYLQAFQKLKQYVAMFENCFE